MSNQGVNHHAFDLDRFKLHLHGLGLEFTNFVNTPPAQVDRLESKIENIEVQTSNMAEVLNEVRRQLISNNNKIDLSDARQRTLDTKIINRFGEVSTRLEGIETRQKDMEDRQKNLDQHSRNINNNITLLRTKIEQMATCLKASEINHSARLLNSWVHNPTGALTPLVDPNTCLPIPEFPTTMEDLIVLRDDKVTSILIALGSSNNTALQLRTPAEKRKLLKTAIGEPTC